MRLLAPSCVHPEGPHPENEACLSSVQGHRKGAVLTSHLYVKRVILVRDLLLKGVLCHMINVKSSYN